MQSNRFKQYVCCKQDELTDDQLIVDAFEITLADKQWLTPGIGPGDFFVMFPGGGISIVRKSDFESSYQMLPAVNFVSGPVVRGSRV